MVGAVRFELTTSCTRNTRASQATLRPDQQAENLHRRRSFGKRIFHRYSAVLAICASSTARIRALVSSRCAREVTSESPSSLSFKSIFRAIRVSDARARLVASSGMLP